MADFRLTQTGQQIQAILDQQPLDHTALDGHIENTTIHVTAGNKTDWNAKYNKPGTGIPKSDLASDVQTSLGKADTAYQKPGTGVPKTDLASGVQTSLNKADTAYQKPGTGIPESDLDSATKTKVDAGGTAYQKPNTGIPQSDMSADVQSKLNAAGSADEAIAAERAAREAAVDNEADARQLVDQSLQGQITTHVSNSDIHVTTQNKTAWNAKYDKPSGGIPKSDLAAAVQTSLGKADTAYQKPGTGIVKGDLASDVQASLNKADAAAPQNTTYTKTEVDNLLSPKQTAAQVQAIVASALASYSTTSEVAAAITSALTAYYTKTVMDGLLANKQDKLTFDTQPVQNSTKPVQSGGIYTAIQNAVSGLVNSAYVQNAINTALASYSTTSQISAMITTALTTTLANYYTKAETNQVINGIVGTIQTQAAAAAAAAEDADEKATAAAESAAAANQKLIDLETYLGTLDPESAASVATALGLFKEEVEQDYAKKNGMYNDMTVGNAMNIISEDIVTEQTTLGITAPNNEIGNGSARMQTIEGDGVAWSQLYDKMAGGASVASEQGQLEFLFGKVVERFTTNAQTTPMPSLFLREFLTGADLTGRVAVTGEGFVPALTEENQSNYTGLHYKVRATHAEAVQRSGEEGSYTYSSAFFVGGANFSASAKRNVIDMALAFGIVSFGGDSGPFGLPTSAPSTLAQMYGWLGSKVGLRDDYDYNGGELIGVKVLQLRSMPGVNLLDPTSGVALCPYYEWENADGLYRIAARNGAVISGVAATALGGQPVAVVEVTAGSVYEVSVPEGDAVVMQVTLSSGSLADCACWQVWDDTTPSDEVGGYSRSVLSLEVARVYGKLNGEGEYVKCFADGVMKGVTLAGIRDIIDYVKDSAIWNIVELDLGSINWMYDATYGWYANMSPLPYSDRTWRGISNKRAFNGHYNNRNVGGISPIYQNAVVVKDSYADAADAKSKLTGTKMWYPVKSTKHYTTLMYDTRPDLTVGEPVLVPLSTYFPGTYQVGNTGVTMQTANWDDQTQRFAGTPQSAAAQTSSVMPGNYVEMLRSLQQKNILDGWVSPDQFHAHQSATVQALNAMATANQLSGQFTLTPQDDVAYSNE